MVSIMDKATFSQLCKLMDAGDDTVKKFVRGMLKIGLMSAVGLVGAGMTEVLGNGVAWLTDALSAAADDSDAPDRSAGTIVDFFKDKTSYSSLEKAQIAHVLMVFSAYFDALQDNAPDACKFVELQGAEKEYLVKYAQTQSWDKDLAEADLFMPTVDADLPKTYTGLVGFYTAMTDKLRIFMEGYMETLPGHKKDRLIGLLNRLPNLAKDNFRAQLIDLSEKSGTFFLHNLFASLGHIQNAVTGIDRKVDRLLLQSTPTGSYSLPVMPDPSGSFLEGSRNDELEELEHLLTQRRTLFIFGVGGIGKTETAIQLGRCHGNAHLLRFTPPIIENQSAIERAVLDLVISNYRYTPSRENMDDIQRRNEEFSQRLAILRDHFSGHMLIIDNFDCPGRTLDQLRGDPCFRALENCGLKLVFTTRYPKGAHPGVEIRPLDGDQLLAVMRKSCPADRATDEQLRQLMKAVDYHTLTCVLIAKTLGDDWAEVTPEQMLEALTNAQLDQDAYPEVVNDQNSGWELRKIYGHLKALFDLSGMSQIRKTVLRYATLLPANGMELKIVQTCLAAEEKESLRALVDTGWITLENRLLSLHPVIREICREELKPDDDNCGAFLNNLLNIHNPKHYDATLYTYMAECFACASDILTDASGEWASTAAYFYFDLGCFSKALPYDLKSLDIQKKYAPDDILTHAAYCHNVGMTYSNLGSHHTALTFLLEALDIHREHLPPEDEDLIQSYNNIGLVYGGLGNYPAALEFQLAALEKLKRRELPEDHPNFAPIYNYLGSTYDCLGDYNTALHYHKLALEIRNKEALTDHPRLAQPCNDVGISYCKLGEYSTALKYLDQAFRIRQKILLSNHPDLAQSNNDLAIVYYRTGNFQQALLHQAEALRIQEEILPPKHPDLATSYNNMGLIHNKLGNHQQALDYHLKDLSICEEVLEEDHPDLAITYNNIGHTYDLLDNQTMALEYMDKALGIQKKRLPKDHPDLAQSYNNVGIIYTNLNEWSKAQDYLKVALQIYEIKLPPNHPNLCICRSNYEYVCSMLD